MQILENLRTLFQARVHIARGFNYFPEFCIRFRMCESTAHRKFEALKISLSVPDLPERMASGEISQIK